MAKLNLQRKEHRKEVGKIETRCGPYLDLEMHPGRETVDGNIDGCNRVTLSSHASVCREKRVWKDEEKMFLLLSH